LESKLRKISFKEARNGRLHPMGLCQMLLSHGP
jgi:hypothetical protein